MALNGETKRAVFTQYGAVFLHNHFNIIFMICRLVKERTATHAQPYSAAV